MIMKEKLNMYTVCMIGWVVGVAISIYLIMKQAGNPIFADMIMVAVVFWVAMMLFIQDVAKPIAEGRLQKGMGKSVLKDYIMCLVADICVIISFLAYISAGSKVFLIVLFAVILLRGLKRTVFMSETQKRF